MKKYLPHITLIVIGTLFVGGLTTLAGSLTPPGFVLNTMYTLDDIYTKLTANTDATLGSGAIPSTPGSASATFHTLTELYNAIPTIDATKVATGTAYLGVTGTMYPATPFKTGQTTCYDLAGASRSCTGTGEDGESHKGITASYTDNGDETITDNNTGLMWRKCSLGLSGASCGTGAASQIDFNTATSTSAGCGATFASHSSCYSLQFEYPVRGLRNWFISRPRK
jgi:hypothetical protein